MLKYMWIAQPSPSVRGSTGWSMKPNTVSEPDVLGSSLGFRNLKNKLPALFLSTCRPY
jgi:hypothetical protein